VFESREQRRKGERGEVVVAVVGAVAMKSEQRAA
jgi:hypothetical protein